jgi:hypothetical protein
VARSGLASTRIEASLEVIHALERCATLGELASLIANAA